MRVKIVIANPADLARRAEMELLVDTGALLSMVPGEALERIGIRPHSRRTFRLADGSHMDRELGSAHFCWNGYEGAAPVVFGRAGDEPVLGVVTLEALGLRVDPVNERLEPMELLMI